MKEFTSVFLSQTLLLGSMILYHTAYSPFQFTYSPRCLKHIFYPELITLHVSYDVQVTPTWRVSDSRYSPASISWYSFVVLCSKS